MAQCRSPVYLQRLVCPQSAEEFRKGRMAQWGNKICWLKSYLNLFMFHLLQTIIAAVVLLAAFDQHHTPLTSTAIAHNPKNWFLTEHYPLVVPFKSCYPQLLPYFVERQNIVILNFMFGKIHLLQVKLRWRTYTYLHSQNLAVEMSAYRSYISPSIL